MLIPLWMSLIITKWIKRKLPVLPSSFNFIQYLANIAKLNKIYLRSKIIHLLPFPSAEEDPLSATCKFSLMKF